MGQQDEAAAKGAVLKPDDLSSISGTHMVEEETCLPPVGHLLTTHMHSDTPTYTQMTTRGKKC